MSDSVAVGLVGAGPWAGMVHAPVLAAGPSTRLAGVWARRPEASAELAGKHGAPSFARVEELFDACEAVAFSVPPDVQADLAVRAVRAGKAVLLEKPLAMDLDGAHRLTDAIAEAGVPSQMVLSMRYSRAARAFIERARGLEPFGGFATFVSSVANGGPFATPWRLDKGPLLDHAPHIVDLLDAALGPVTAIHAHSRDRIAWVALTLEHEGGATSQAALSMARVDDPAPPLVEIYGRKGNARVDFGELGDDAFPTMVAEFAAAVRGGPRHPLDAAHGLRLQKILAAAEAQLPG
ncbi:MAG: Gfo/Idh/MocA family protein [Spirillospora sp.]